MDGSAGRSVIRRGQGELAALDYPNGQDAFGLQDMYRILQRRRWVIGGTCAIATLLGLAYAVFRPPIYEASAVLMMRPNEPNVAASAEGQRQAEPDNGYVQSQVEILKSPAVLRQLVDRQHLANDPRWASGFNEEGRRASATRAAYNAVNVNRRDGTYVVEVSARSQDPEQAANMANDLVNIYFASREQARIENASQTSDWLSGRLNELRGEVQAREDEVEQYRAQHGLLTVDGAELAETQLRDAETTALAARADLAERQARYRQMASMLRAGGSAETTAGALTSDTMTALRSRQADVTRRLAEYGERYGNLHPTVIAARAERDDINRQIEAEVNRLARNLDDEAEIAAARAASLQSNAASVRSRLVGNNAQQVRLRELERNAQAARAVYENFLLRFHEVSDGGGLGGDAQVVASAVTPTEPVSRSPLLVVLLAAALGLTLGGLVAFLMEQFTTTLQTSDDVERKTGLPILTSIPQVSSRTLDRLGSTERHPAGFIVAKPMSAYAEAMRMLRTRIAHARLANDVRVVALTSAMAGEGKTSTTLSLARATALAGRKVIVLDCDLRRRSLNHMLCIEPRMGIANVLRGEAHWKEVVGRDEASGAHVLPAAWEEFSSEELFNTAAMTRLMRELSEVYDLVLLDCAPVLTLADVRDLAAQAHGVVVVARCKKTQVLALQTAISELRAVDANVLGVAFNGVDIGAPGRLSYADPLYFSHAQSNSYVT